MVKKLSSRLVEYFIMWSNLINNLNISCTYIVEVHLIVVLTATWPISVLFLFIWKYMIVIVLIL